MSLEELQKNYHHRLFTTKKPMQCGMSGSWGTDPEVEISTGGLKCLGTKPGREGQEAGQANRKLRPGCAEF